MSDIRYIISVDDKGAIKSIKDFSGALDESKKVAGETESKFGGLWKQFAIGTLAVDALRKGFGLLKDFVGGSITAAMDSETAQKNLETALATTGRTVSAMLPDLTNFADEIMRQTTVDDEAAKGALALMVQLTDLDEKGLEKATEGAIGLAKVFNIDLETASRVVAKAMSGDMDLLGRYIPQVRDLKTEQEKHALVMETLGTWYGRATAETNTFSGSLTQLKNWWGEVKESVGKAITENESLRQTIKDITLSIRELVESGKLEDWISKTVAGIQTVIDLLGKVPEGITGLGNALAGEITGINATMGQLESEGRAKVYAFRDSLLVIKPRIEELRKEIEKGPDSWDAYKRSLAETDKKLADNKDTIKGWFTEAGKALGFFKDVKQPIIDAGNATNGFNLEIGRSAYEIETDFLPRVGDVIGYAGKAKVGFDLLKNPLKTFQQSLKDVADQAMVSEATILQFLWNVRADFLQTIGIIIPRWQDIPAAASQAISRTRDYFAGLYTDIATGFGDTVQKWAEHAMSLRGVARDLWDDIKKAFFRTIGEMVAGETLGLFKGLFSGIAKSGEDAMDSATSSIGKAVSGLGTGLATLITSLATAIATAATTLAAAAPAIITVGAIALGIFAGFKLLGSIFGGGGGKQGDVTYWLSFIKDNTQVLRNYFEGGLAADITNTARALCGSIPEKLDNIFSMIDMSRIDLVDIGEQIKEGVYGTWDILKGIKIGQYGFNEIATRPTLYMAEPGERVIMVPPGRPNISNSNAFNFHFSISTLDADSFHGFFMKKIVPLINSCSKNGPVKIDTSALVNH